MKKSIIAAGAASVALAAMPIVGVFATDDTNVQDTINVTVNSSCTFRTTSSASIDGTYAASGANGASVNPSTGKEGSTTNVHTFNVFCNNNKGYTISATANDLTATGTNDPAITDTFAYKRDLSETVGDNGEWHAQIAATGLTVAQLPDSTSGSSTGTIITRPSASGATATAGDTWTATYTALIGTKTTAATYSGTITYTLAATN